MTKIRARRISRVHVVYICVSYFEARLPPCVLNVRVFKRPAATNSRPEPIIYRRACARVSEFYAANWFGRSEFMKFVRASQVSDRQTTWLFADAAFLSRIELCTSRNNRVGFVPSLGSSDLIR